MLRRSNLQCVCVKASEDLVALARVLINCSFWSKSAIYWKTSSSPKYWKLVRLEMLRTSFFFLCRISSSSTYL